MTTLSLNDRGLDLILGGGLTWIERVPGKSSTTILLRGEAGTGKTLSALHIARSLAMALDGDIAWTGVEILPAEVAAQHTSLWPDDTTFSVVHRGSPESVERRAIHARLLGPLEDAAQLGDALEALWPEFAHENPPRVLVLDSLTDGYALGAKVPRVVVDGVCKLAAHWNVALVLVEEARLGEPSPWPYAVDTVVELRAAERGVRSLSVAKHRFAPSDAGPHALSFLASTGMRVSPRVGSWTRMEPSTSPPSRGWLKVPGLAGNKLATAFAVFGPASTIRRYALSLVEQHGTTVLFDLSQPRGARGALHDGVWMGLRAADATPSETLRDLLDAPELTAARTVVLGDIIALRDVWDARETYAMLATLGDILRRRDVPLVLFETSAARADGVNPQAFHPSQWVPRAGLALPMIAALGDITAECVVDDFAQRTSKDLPFVVTDRRTGEVGLVPFPFAAP